MKTKKNENGLNHYFYSTMLMSGTPRRFQNSVAQKSGKAIRCSFEESIKSHINLCPKINLIHTFYRDNDYRLGLYNATKAAMERETEICGKDLDRTGIPMRVKMLECLQTIDDCDALCEKLKEEGNECHTVVIHSHKIYQNDGERISTECSVDGTSITNEEAFQLLEDIDHDKVFNGDNLPILVINVDMLGEGLNIKSFNSVIISTASDIKSVQQLGRVVRDDVVAVDELGNEYTKMEVGHANVYCLLDNSNKINTVVSNLYNTLGNCLEWGSETDVRGSGANNEDGIPEYSEAEWAELSYTRIEELLNCDFNSFSISCRNSVIRDISGEIAGTIISKLDTSTIQKLLKYGKSMFKSCGRSYDCDGTPRAKDPSKKSKTSTTEEKKPSKKKETDQDIIQSLIRKALRDIDDYITDPEPGKTEFDPEIMELSDYNGYCLSVMGWDDDIIDIIGNFILQG